MASAAILTLSRTCQLYSLPQCAGSHHKPSTAGGNRQLLRVDRASRSFVRTGSEGRDADGALGHLRRSEKPYEYKTRSENYTLPFSCVVSSDSRRLLP